VQLAIVEQIEQVLMSKHGGEFQFNGEIRFLCPEHDDHNPSADWSPVKQVWICRACDAGGGYVDLAKSLEISMPSTNGAGGSESWDVRDKSGVLVARKHRGLDKDGNKTYWWDPKPPSGSKELPLFGTERINDFDPAQPVIITEGEKAAQYLINIGVQSLGTSTGASVTPDPERHSHD
jgi:DNA primase